ncbi:MAG: hypothetical protein HY337_10900, partial [Gemmatimonadetes bacterium]|nr:hypothetical protein [Gemmatimonadota bacterium]
MRGAIIATVALQLAWPISAAAQGRYVKVPVRAAITDFRLFQRNRTTDLAASTDSVRLLPGEFVVSRFADSVLTRSDSSGSITWELPIQLTGIDGDGDLVDLQAAVIVEAGGLRRRPDGLFAGSILLGMQNARDPSRRHPLGRSIAVLVTANADSVRPEQVGIDHTNLPFQRVQLVAIAPPDTVAVRVRPEFDLRGVDINLPVVRPSLMLAASPQRIQGFGLESAALTVRAVGVTGAEGMVVSLTSDRSAPEPGEVPLSAAGTGSSEIRSSGLGRATVTAASPP